MIQGGDTWNVIPQSVHAARHRPLVQAGGRRHAGGEVRSLATGIAAAFGAEAEVVFDRGYPATVNSVDETGWPPGGAHAVAGEARVQESAGRPWAARISPSC